MAVKRTVAIVGADKEKGIIIDLILPACNYRLLRLFNEAAIINKVGVDTKKCLTDAEIELITCMKDGCWEANIILLAINSEAQREVVEKIRDFVFKIKTTAH